MHGSEVDAGPCCCSDTSGSAAAAAAAVAAELQALRASRAKYQSAVLQQTAVRNSLLGSLGDVLQVCILVLLGSFGITCKIRAHRHCCMLPCSLGSVSALGYLDVGDMQQHSPFLLVCVSQGCAAAARSRSASPRRSPMRLRAPPGSADQHLLHMQRHHAAHPSSSPAAQHAKKCLFSSPPPAGTHLKHRYCDQAAKQGIGAVQAGLGSSNSTQAGAWLRASSGAQGSLLRALHPVFEASSSGGGCQPARSLRPGVQQEGRAAPGGDCSSSSCGDNGESSSSSSMAASQVEAWQQALSNSLSRALNKLGSVP
jgi:hypothetical protein